jgi:excinuclease ABC subunit C
MSTDNSIENRDEKLSRIVKDLPDNPGVYEFFDSTGNIIYIGKAKNLKKRVSSYFNREAYDSNKLKVLVSKIEDIRFILLESESDALLLENNLIKKYQPRYNILLKDDKTFPWICIKNENFPRVFYTRNYIEDGSEYFGPYTSVVMVRTLLDLVRKLYPLRTCNLNLSDEKIKTAKYKPCLEFHVGNCKAPCIANQTEKEYDSNILNIRQILKGNLSDVIKYLQDLMEKYVQSLEFENAQIIKNKVDIIKNFQSKSTIVNSSINNVDVFSIVEAHNYISVNYLRVANGAIIQVHSVDIKRKLEESLAELLSIAIVDIRQKMMSNSNEIITTILPDILLKGINYTIPKKGDKLKLLELSERNARNFLNERLKLAALKTERLRESKNVVMERMQLDLNLKKAPIHIECFDNSNLQGTNPVASCVVFRNGKPSNKEYRHFNIKTVEGPNDFASMSEIVYRRYKRLLDENQELPDLIIVDGGKGQLSAAVESLEKLSLYEIPIIGIAKRLEEIYYPNDPVPIYIDKNSTSLKIIQHIRNEAHRFGINFHRLKRSGSSISSALDNIQGIGEHTKAILYKNFKSYKNIVATSEEDLAKVVGNAKAKIIKSYVENNS